MIDGHIFGDIITMITEQTPSSDEDHDMQLKAPKESSEWTMN